MSKYLIDIQRCGYRTETAEFRANVTGLDKLTTVVELDAFAFEVRQAFEALIDARFMELYHQAEDKRHEPKPTRTDLG